MFYNEEMKNTKLAQQLSLKAEADRLLAQTEKDQQTNKQETEELINGQSNKADQEYYKAIGAYNVLESMICTYRAKYIAISTNVSRLEHILQSMKDNGHSSATFDDGTTWSRAKVTSSIKKLQAKLSIVEVIGKAVAYEYNKARNNLST